MNGILARLRGRSFDELSLRGRQWLRSRLDRGAFAVRDHRTWQAPARPTPPAEWLAARPALNHLRAPGAAAAVAGWVSDNRAGWLGERQRVAAGLAEGRCPLLGYAGLAVGNPPRWHYDAVTGKAAPRRHWTGIDPLDAESVGDHKVLWEANRHQYLLAPAMCWLADRDVAHFELVQSHLEDWLSENPPGVGVNWASSLEVAYRAVAWTWLWWLLRDAPWDGRLLARMAAAARYHGRHVEAYLSTYFSPNTHLTGEALGLFYLGTVLPEAPEAARWRALGAGTLEAWLGRHVAPDGTYFEQATQYQRYTAEIYLHYLLLARATGWPAAGEVAASMERQFEVLRSLADAAGRMPLVGDDDGGMLLPLDGQPPDDVAGLLQAGATVLERADLAVGGRDEPTQAAWLCGPSAAELQRRQETATPAWTDRHFIDGGLVTLRTGWGPGDSVAVVDAGPHGVLNCGHAHADALAMTLTLGPTPVFIDRGTFTYVGPERNAFRETASHNTLEFDRESSVVPRGPFRWGRVPPRPAVRLASDATMAILEAVATAHVETSCPSTHRRLVVRGAGGAWAVYDEGLRRDASNGIVRWQLAPGLSVADTGTGLLEIVAADGATVAWLAAWGAAGTRVAARDVSRRYGSREPAQFIEVLTGPRLRALSVIVPTGGGDAPAVAEASGNGANRILEWRDGAGRHRLLWSDGAIPGFAHGGWSGDARVAWWTERQAAGEGGIEAADLFVTVGATRIEAPGQEPLPAALQGAGAAVAVLRRGPAGWASVPAFEAHGGS